MVFMQGLILIGLWGLLWTSEGFRFQTTFRRIGQRSILMLSTTANPELIKEELGLNLHPRRFRKATKQLATLGPASSSLEMIERLFLAGADVFRLNFSHGDYEEKLQLVARIRQIEAKYNHPIAILADLQGPKLRVGVFEHNSVHLKEGQKFQFDLWDQIGTHERVTLPHPEILNTLAVGDILLLDDGKLRMEVIETTMHTSSDPTERYVSCKVITGGVLSNKKGVNTPTIVLPISPLTEKDRRDLEFILQQEIDWIALSFVQRPEDMQEMRKIVGPSKKKIMTKLEKPSAINYVNEIVDLSDGIMVARGDLGVEMYPWDVPVLQKRIVETCKIHGKPVVIATQMMESMIENPTPTRAEASDCATAIYDSSDAVMLSAESAVGHWPVESVAMQQSVINTVEMDENFQISLDRFAQEVVSHAKDSTTVAITMATRQVADTSRSAAIVCFTASGGTTLRIAKLRPKVPIVAVCEEVALARQLALVWGVHPIVVEKHIGEFNVANEIRKVCAILCQSGFADPERDLLTITGGLPWGTRGVTNIIRVCSAKGPEYWFDDSDDQTTTEAGVEDSTAGNGHDLVNSFKELNQLLT